MGGSIDQFYDKSSIALLCISKTQCGSSSDDDSTVLYYTLYGYVLALYIQSEAMLNRFICETSPYFNSTMHGYSIISKILSSSTACLYIS